MVEGLAMINGLVHCRIGSSESLGAGLVRFINVHCRIGSSENAHRAAAIAVKVHCRIGSSEICGC